MQHTSRKGPRAACSQPSWFERDDLHLRDERVERPSFVGVGQKSSCRVSYTAAAAPRRRAFFMGRVLRDFAVVKKRLCVPWEQEESPRRSAHLGTARAQLPLELLRLLVDRRHGRRVMPEWQVVPGWQVSECSEGTLV